MKVYIHPEYDYVNVVEVLKSEIKYIDLCMCAQPKETLGSFYSRQEDKPDVLINAGFFATSTGDSCFNIVDDGVVYSENSKYKWGMGITKDHKELKYGSIAMPSYGLVDFVSGYPNLVDGGKSCAPWTFATEINYKALRSMIGYNDTSIFFVTVNKPGMTFTTMANLMIDLGCTHAVNLDGGGSSRLMVGGEVINSPTENRAVDSVFALWLTDEARNNYYGNDEEKDYYEYVVQPGDSWWKIADNELDNAYLYTKLSEYNNWDGKTSLQPGDIIKIPKNKFKEEDSTANDEENNIDNDSNTPIDPDDTERPDQSDEKDPSVDGMELVYSVYLNKNENRIYHIDKNGNKIIHIELDTGAVYNYIDLEDIGIK